MSGGLKYGNVALGVESALPAITLPARRSKPGTRLRRLLNLLVAALRRWA
jgi:hypothetical protein